VVHRRACLCRRAFRDCRVRPPRQSRPSRRLAGGVGQTGLRLCEDSMNRYSLAGLGLASAVCWPCSVAIGRSSSKRIGRYKRIPAVPL
jgi:hypothetical protein